MSNRMFFPSKIGSCRGLNIKTEKFGICCSTRLSSIRPQQISVCKKLTKFEHREEIKVMLAFTTEQLIMLHDSRLNLKTFLVILENLAQFQFCIFSIVLYTFEEIFLKTSDN